LNCFKNDCFCTVLGHVQRIKVIVKTDKIYWFLRNCTPSPSGGGSSNSIEIFHSSHRYRCTDSPNECLQRYLMMAVPTGTGGIVWMRTRRCRECASRSMHSGSLLPLGPRPRRLPFPASPLASRFSRTPQIAGQNTSLSRLLLLLWLDLCFLNHVQIQALPRPILLVVAL